MARSPQAPLRVAGRNIAVPAMHAQTSPADPVPQSTFVAIHNNSKEWGKTAKNNSALLGARFVANHYAGGSSIFCMPFGLLQFLYRSKPLWKIPGTEVSSCRTARVVPHSMFGCLSTRSSGGKEESQKRHEELQSRIARNAPVVIDFIRFACGDKCGRDADCHRGCGSGRRPSGCGGR